MRVLMAVKPGGDPYTTALYGALRKIDVDVDFGLDRFWLQDRSYDIVHLHWPEALFGWKPPMLPELRLLLNEVLPSWQRVAKLLITRHNMCAHFAQESPIWRVLYEHVYDHVDGVIHLGGHGVKEFGSEIKRTGWIDTVIPCHTFRAYGNPVDKVQARRALRIPSGSKVVLVFGSLRLQQERILVQEAFSQLNVGGELLLAPNFGVSIRPPRRKPLERLLWEVRNRSVIWPRRMHLGRHFVPDEFVHLYFSAADVVFVPRLDTLNSGLVPLAFQFGRIAVGPDIGNIGPVLKATGNPVFDPASTSSVVAALRRGLESAASDIGVLNARFAAEHWSPERIAMMHRDFYERACHCEKSGEKHAC